MSGHHKFGQWPAKAFGPIPSAREWLYPFLEFSPIRRFDLMFMFAVTSKETKFGNSDL